MSKMTVAGLLYIAVVLSAPAATYYVDGLRPDDSGAGTSWETAKKTIQAAVNLTVDGDTVFVSNGVYKTGATVASGCSLSNRLAVTTDIVIRSLNGSAETIIEGSGTDLFGTAAAVRCAYLSKGWLQGFTFRNGATFSSGQSGGQQADWAGGGVYVEPGAVNAGLSNCVVQSCEASVGGGASGGTLVNCTLSGNTATTGSHSDGGGAYGSTLIGCTLSGNAAHDGGGAAEGTLYSCVLSGNSASRCGGGAAGATLYNCLLYGNTAASYGGGGFWGTLVNCTLSGNQAATGGGSSECGLNNCIVWGNTQPDVSPENYSGSACSYSCTSPLQAGAGNIASDPLFVDAASGDYRLAPASPCFNAGSAALAVGAKDLLGNPRVQGSGVEMGAYEGAVVGTPVFSPPTGSVMTNELTFSLSCPTDGADIYYTTNGAEPALSSAVFKEAVTLRQSAVVKARAFMAGMEGSATAVAAYTVVTPGFDIVDVKVLCKGGDGTYSATRRQPLLTDGAGFEARLANVRMSPSNIQLFVTYYIGTNVWGAGNWPAGQAVTKPLYPTEGDQRVFRTSAEDAVPAQRQDQVVQYQVWATYQADGPGVQRQVTFDNPAWYYPVDLNQTYAAQGWSPYYIVYGAPLGAVWINEVNAWDFIESGGVQVFGVWDHPYIEIAVPAGMDLGGWSVDLAQNDYTARTITIPYGLPAQAPATNGFAFFVISDAGPFAAGVPPLPKADVQVEGLMGVIPVVIPGGLRLRRPMGMYEHCCAYDWNPSFGNIYDGSIWAALEPSQRFVYVGREILGGSLGVSSGVGLCAADWRFPSEWTPGAVNASQTVASAESAMAGILSAAVPVISPLSGTVGTNTIALSISCATEGATVRYTLDGSEPTPASPVCGGTLILAQSATVRAKASKALMLDSASAAATFSVIQSVAEPVLNPADGTSFAALRKIVISCATEGAEIRYTTDSSEPTTASPLYAGPFTVCQTTTVRARAFKADMADSPVSSATYYRLPPLNEALDATNLTVTTAASAYWISQSAVAHDGSDAAQSGAITDGQTSWMETTVAGAGTLAFWWRADCEDDPEGDGWDFLRVLIDGAERCRLDGVTDWRQVSLSLSEGVHVVRWEYVKDESLSGGRDCAWVDQVSFVPVPTETSSTPVPVPFAWLEQYPVLLGGAGGDYEAAALADADGDGHVAWQEFVAGSIPTNRESVLRALIAVSNGVQRITWSPDLGGGRVYAVQGKTNLADAAWGPTNAGTRFFRVSVELP